MFRGTVQPSRLELCCHCAGVLDTRIVLKTHLKAPAGPYSVVLPICNACIDSGCPIMVRSARNSKAKQARLEHQDGREVAVPGSATGIASSSIGSAFASATAFATTSATAIATASVSATTTTYYSRGQCGGSSGGASKSIAEDRQAQEAHRQH